MLHIGAYFLHKKRENKMEKDYKELWKKRKIHLIIANLIFGGLGIYVAVSAGKNYITEAISLWILGSWTLGTMLSTFSKNGGIVSSFANNVVKSMILGSFAMDGVSTLAGIMFVIALFKAMIGALILFVILFVGFFVFPITTVIYFVKSRKTEVIVNEEIEE